METRGGKGLWRCIAGRAQRRPRMTAAPEDRANSPARARVIKRTDYTPEAGGAWVWDCGGADGTKPIGGAGPKLTERTQFGRLKQVDETNPGLGAEGRLTERTQLEDDGGLTGRGRDSGRPLPPAQIRTSGFPAYGSYLG